MQSAVFQRLLRYGIAGALGAGTWCAGAGELPAADWSMLGRGAEQHHYSPLKSINDGNVAKLGLAWHADLPTADGLIANPLVADGLVYQIGGWSNVWAVDVRSGKLVWSYDPKVKVVSQYASMWSHHLNRGVALWKDEVIFGTSDCRLIALKRKTGEKVWDVRACEDDGSRAINGAPRVGGDKVFIGNTDVDTGVGRGSIDAYDAATGKHLWRFYTLPGDPARKENQTRQNEIAIKTWGTPDGWKSAGGGSTWEGITYDPVLNRVYFGVDGPYPWNNSRRKGDNLFTDSIVAVDANTGEYLWHYQEVPNDTWDLNSCMPIVIAELPIGGKPTRVLMHSPKNGFFYLLEAKTGKLLSAEKIGNPNWASKIDLATGRPVLIPDMVYPTNAKKEAMVNPGPIGFHNWHPMSFSELTGLVYVPITDIPVYYGMSKVTSTLAGDTLVDYYAGMTEKNKDSMGRLVAWDPVAGKERWRVTQKLGTNGGTMSTAGNLVFQGEGTGDFSAYRADNGQKLWSMSTGSAIQAAPSTVEVDGEQLVLVAVGDGGGIGISTPRYSSTEKSRGPSRLLAFKLGGTDKMSTEMPPIVYPKPPRPRPSRELAAKGKVLYGANGCDYCHGPRAERWTMSVPDLRRSTPETHDQFAGIVVGGLREAKGMPRFKGLSTDDAEALRAYVLENAWENYDRRGGK